MFLSIWRIYFHSPFLRLIVFSSGIGKATHIEDFFKAESYFRMCYYGKEKGDEQKIKFVLCSPFIFFHFSQACLWNNTITLLVHHPHSQNTFVISFSVPFERDKDITLPDKKFLTYFFSRYEMFSSVQPLGNITWFVHLAIESLMNSVRFMITVVLLQDTVSHQCCHRSRHHRDMKSSNVGDPQLPRVFAKLPPGSPRLYRRLHGNLATDEEKLKNCRKKICCSL